MQADLFKINYVEKEVEHEIEFAILQRKYQLTMLILKANILSLAVNYCCQSWKALKIK